MATERRDALKSAGALLPGGLSGPAPAGPAVNAADVSGYQHNARGGFLMLWPGLYASGAGEGRFRESRFPALAG